jgi:hypothetical protein
MSRGRDPRRRARCGGPSCCLSSTGIRGTGSHDFTITDVFVPKEHVHGASEESARPQPLYQFVGWTHVAHAALGLGIGRVAIATSRLDRCLRDAHTAAAHIWVASDNYELAGRLLLGLDPGNATI